MASSNPQRIQQHLERKGNSSEALCFDPTTGKLTVKPQQEARNPSDTAIMLDMNKEGSGGFFFFRGRKSSQWSSTVEAPVRRS